MDIEMVWRGRLMVDRTEEAEPADIANKIRKIQDKFEEDYEIDPSQYYVFSRDLMRVDVGLLIQRPPIFMRMRDQDFDFLKKR